MRTKGPFVKVVLLNEVVEHPLFKPNFDIGRFFDPFNFFSIYPYYLKNTIFTPMIHMPLKWHHINKCNKNCKKVDILTSILACLNSFAPICALKL